MQNKKQSRRKTLCVEVERNKMPDPEEDQAGPKVPVQTGRFRPISDRYPHSTADQQTLPLQISSMREYAARRGWTVVASIEDVGSGAKDRPKREELVKLAKRRQVDVILVWRLDRWGRSVADLIGTLQELTAIGVGFVSITESLDLTTPSGRALAGMLAVFAEFERDILRERVKSGMAAASKRGTH